MRKQAIFSPRRQLACAVVVGLAASQAAHAALTIVATPGGSPTGVNKLNFDDLTVGPSTPQSTTGPNGTATVSFVTDGQVALGPISGVAAPPFLSGANGAGFGFAGGTQPNGADATKYLTSGVDNDANDGRAIVTFPSDVTYVGLLWGSIDNYNTLELVNSANTVIGTVTGSQVTASPNGNQGLQGTSYVNIYSTVPFNSIRAISNGQYAFEFDNVAYGVVPEPSTYIAGGLALLPLLFGLRSRISKK